MTRYNAEEENGRRTLAVWLLLYLASPAIFFGVILLWAFLLGWLFG